MGEFRLQTFMTDSEQQTEQLGARLGASLRGTEVIALFGGLGAGKTALTRGLASALGVADGVSSPTFALVHEYEGTCPIYHFDMYRINGFDDLYSTGFFDYLGTGVLVIEWSENIEGYLPEERITVTITPVSETTREITIKGAEPL